MKKFKIKRIKLDVTSSFGPYIAFYNYNKDKKLGKYNKKNQKDIKYLKSLDMRCPLCNKKLKWVAKHKVKGYADYSKNYFSNLNYLNLECPGKHWRYIMDNNYSEAMAGYNSVYFIKGKMQYMGFFFRSSGDCLLYYGNENIKHVLPTLYIKGLKSIDYKNIEKLLILK